MSGTPEKRTLGSAPDVNPHIGTGKSVQRSPPRPGLMTKPCVRCGAVDRDKKGACRPCKKAGDVAYRESHKAECNARRKRWLEANTKKTKDTPCVKCGAVDWTPRGRCRPCAKAYGAMHWKETRDRGRETNAKWRAAHIDESKARCTKWHAENREKAKASSKSWRTVNHERHIAYNKKHYTENREKELASMLRRYWANPEKWRAAHAKWCAENPEQNRVANHKRRARVTEAGGSFTAQEIKDMLKRQKNKCVVCRVNISKNYHIDHIMPVALGGHGGITNIQLLCPFCNQSKHSKHPVDFMQSRGFLL